MTQNSIDINKVGADLIKDSAKSLLAFTKKTWHTSRLKSELEIEKAFQNYIEYIYPVSEKTKTLLYKNVAKPLYNFYEPIDVSLEGSIISTNNVATFFEAVNKRIIVTGTGGIGKSTLLKHLFLNSIDVGFRIPLLIELRNLNTKIQLDDKFDFTNYIYECAKTNNLITEIEYFKYALEAGLILIIFDGLDELNGDNNSFIEKEIISFSRIFPELNIIVSSRPSNQFIGWHEFIEVNAQNLTKQQALSLVSKFEIENEVAKENFYKHLDGDFFDKYNSFASIPLLLNIMFLTYEMNGSIPDNLNDFYEMAFLALFQTHDASKSSFSRDMKSNMTYEQFKDIFCHIAFNSYYNGEYNFTESSLLEYIRLAFKQQSVSEVAFFDYLQDMQNSVCMIIKDGLKFTFTHRSFQEYFAAVFISKQPDEVQKIVFNKFAKNLLNLHESIFFGALKFMQPNRYNKNFLYAIMEPYKNYRLEDLYEELVSDIYFPKDNPNSYTMVINNFLLWQVYKEIFNSQHVEFGNLIENIPLAEYNLNPDDNYKIDIRKLKKSNKLLDYINKIDGKVLGLSLMKKWIYNFENSSTSSNPLAEILGLKSN